MFLVIYDFGQASLEQFLLSQYPLIQPILNLAKTVKATYKIVKAPTLNSGNE